MHHHVHGFEFLGLIGYGIEWILVRGMAQSCLCLVGQSSHIAAVPEVRTTRSHSYLVLCAQEFSHINSWLHHRLHGNRAAKCGLFAIAMIMVGHITEHFHHEHGQHDDQVKFKALEDRILVLEESLRQSEINNKPGTPQ